MIIQRGFDITIRDFFNITDFRLRITNKYNDHRIANKIKYSDQCGWFFQFFHLQPSHGKFINT
jgi:hypothetical protein